MTTTTFTGASGASASASTLQPAEKGLKHGALGLISTTVVAVASTAPAYSLAATLFFVAVIAGTHSAIIAVIAFIPMLLTSIGYNELNRVDPDCGTTFTWATRTFGRRAGPWLGWTGGWGIVAADILVMASLAQVAGQYGFLLFNANGIGTNPASGWVLLVGILWIVAMTYICYRGIEISANFQKALLGIELTMLTVMSVVAFVKLGTGHAPPGHLAPAASWFNPFGGISPSGFVTAVLLMVFIYWGWDTAVSVNEETKDSHVTPGRAAVIATFVLLAIYFVVILAAQSYAGLGTGGIGLLNSAHESDVLSVLGTSIFGTTWYGKVLSHLLLLMVLSSAAASTQTTILPTARTTLSMAVYRSIPKSFARMHRRYLTPTVSTVAMGAISIALYVPMNYLSGGLVIGDAVSACAVFIALYYGMTGITCVWYYRHNLTSSARNFFMQGLLPGLGGVMLWAALGWSLYYYWSPINSYTSWQMPFPPHWHMGGVFVIDMISIILGIIFMVVQAATSPAFFRGETLNMGTATLVPDGAPLPAMPPAGR
jgi:amino acid transporter